MAEVLLLATERGRELLAEARAATREKLRQIQAQKGDAADVGGNAWHDNFSFETLVEQERVQQRELERLNREFDRLAIVGKPQGDLLLQIGHYATIELEDGTEKTFEVVGFAEGDMKANPPKVVYLAPIIKELFGHEVGAEAEVSLPSGKQIVALTAISLTKP